VTPCPKCGKPVTPGATDCAACGALLREDAREEAENAPNWASAPRVSVWRYVGLFALVYVPLMIVVAIVLSVTGTKLSLNVACLFVAAIVTASAFVKKHRRPFVGAEYWTVLGGSIAVDLVLQTIPAIPMFLSGKMTVMAYSIALVFIGALHGLGLAVMYSSLMVKMYVRRTAR
jgi:hypothetical protein